VQKQMANPDYKEDNEIYAYNDFSWIGFDLWQVKSGTIFENILITDSVEEAKEYANQTWAKKKDGEKKMFDEKEEAKRKEEEAKAKAAEAEKPADEHAGHDHDHDEL